MAKEKITRRQKDIPRLLRERKLKKRQGERGKKKQ